MLPNPTFKVFLNSSTSDLRRDLPTTFAALTLLQSSRTTTNKLTLALLSWDSSNSPPPRSLHVSTPSQCCHRPSAYRYYAVSHVPSSWFRTTSTVYSTQSLRTYCIPLSTMGSATFPFQLNLCSTRETGQEKTFPQRISYPSKNIPHQQPYRVTTTVTLLPLSKAAQMPRHPKQLLLDFKVLLH